MRLLKLLPICLASPAAWGHGISAADKAAMLDGGFQLDRRACGMQRVDLALQAIDVHRLPTRKRGDIEWQHAGRRRPCQLPWHQEQHASEATQHGARQGVCVSPRAASRPRSCRRSPGTISGFTRPGQK